MTKKKVSWDNIPSLEGLEVDWDYEPDNPLGKRTTVRIGDKQLHSLIAKENTPVKLLTSSLEHKGYLVDISQGGIAVLLDSQLPTGQPVKIGFFLGNEKIVANALVRNIVAVDNKFRTGIEFVGLKKVYDEYIAGLISSSVYKAVK